MDPDIFESIMLICFGSAWPFSIYKTWTSKSASGKSLSFITIIFIGYVSGIVFEVLGEFNDVIYLYILNFIMVLTDIVLTLRYRQQ
jgi:hypothetical protein